MPLHRVAHACPNQPLHVGNAPEFVDHRQAFVHPLGPIIRNAMPAPGIWHPHRPTRIRHAGAFRERIPVLVAPRPSRVRGRDPRSSTKLVLHHPWAGRRHAPDQSAGGSLDRQSSSACRFRSLFRALEFGKFRPSTLGPCCCRARQRGHRGFSDMSPAPHCSGNMLAHRRDRHRRRFRSSAVSRGSSVPLIAVLFVVQSSVDIDPRFRDGPAQDCCCQDIGSSGCRTCLPSLVRIALG